MKVDRALDVDEIYEEVKDYDLVLSVDAPLVDALKKRVDEARLGKFAVTPRRLVYAEARKELKSKRDVFHEVVRRTDLGWREASHLLDKAVSCWQETGALENIFQYEGFDTEEMRKVVEVLRDTDNIFRAMDSFRIEGKNVAVVGTHQFNALDKGILPKDYDTVELFCGEEERLSDFKVFGSEVDIVETVRRNLERLDPRDVAIVVDPESRYQPLLQSALEAEGISYTSRQNLRDDPHFRSFLTFCRAGVDRGRTMVRDVQPLLRYMGLEVSVEHNNKYIGNLGLEELDEFENLLDEVRGSSFAEVVDLFEEKSGADMDRLKEVLGEVGFEDVEVDEEKLNVLEHYFDTFDVELDQEGYGVLFASPKSTAYIDKPVVFHVGMDVSWSPESPDVPWVDRKEFDKQYLKNFKILVQNSGSHYLVQDKIMNEEVTPCLYLNDIVGGEFDGFVDLPHERYFPGGDGEEGGFGKEERDVEVGEEEVISQSSLNRLVQCPRNYYITELVTTADKDVMVKGKILHDFAEFYVNHPDFVEKKGREKFADMMVEEMRPYVDDLELEVLRTEFLLGMESIISYLEEEGYEEIKVEGYDESGYGNFFAEEFGKSVWSSITEAWFENPELGCKGKVDLIRNGRHLVDYKTGRKKSARGVVTSSNIDLFEDDPNFQALMYLAHHRTVNPGEKLKFTFYHLLENRDDMVGGEGDLSDNITTITYYPRTFEEQITKKEMYDYLNSSNTRSELLESLILEEYREVLEGVEFEREDTYDKDRMEEKYMEELESRCRPLLEVGRGEDVTENQLRKACRSVLRKLVTARKENYFKEDIDRFEDFVQKKLDELNKYKKSRFPVGDIDLDEIRDRDLIFVGKDM